MAGCAPTVEQVQRAKLTLANSSLSTKRCKKVKELKKEIKWVGLLLQKLQPN
jgi:hypothetical protein